MIRRWHEFRHSLAVKLVAASLVVELVMLSVLVVTNAHVMSVSLGDQMTTRIAEVETLLNAALAVPLVQRDNGALQDVLGAVRRERGIEYLILWDARGTVMARSGFEPPKTRTGEQARDLDMPITLGGQTYGRLHAVMSTALFGEARRTLLSSSVAIAVAEVMLSTVLLSLIGFVLTRRLRSVAATSEAIAAGDLSARVRGGGDDEVSRLGSSFNQMAEALEVRIRDLATLSQAVEQSPVSVVITDLNGTIQYVNPQFCAVTGYEMAEVVGRNPRLLKSGYTSAEAYESLWETIGSGGVWRGLFYNRRKDGSHYWEEAAIAPVADASGRIVQYVAVKQDVTDMRRREEELRRAVDHLTAANQELQRFAYVASHDLQEPLRTVVSFSQLLERRFAAQLDKEADDYIRLVVGAGKRMHDLINDLLAYSRLGQADQAPEPVAAGAAFRMAMENLRDSLAKSGADVQVGPLPEVMSQEFQLVQVFQHLVGNAIKFRLPGRTPRIAVTAIPEGGMWRFAVADNGIGFDPSEQDVFEIFRRLHPPQTYPGTGIGLAICRRIIQRHGGRIWVTSQPGEGSTFYFTLPPATIMVPVREAG
jgi:PAS domain S-box-containing protein